jgi:hypothetical protein
MKPRLDGDDGLVWSQQKHPRNAGARNSVMTFLSQFCFFLNVNP